VNKQYSVMKCSRITVASTRFRTKCPDVAAVSSKFMSQMVNNKEIFFAVSVGTTMTNWNKITV